MPPSHRNLFPRRLHPLELVLSVEQVMLKMSPEQIVPDFENYGADLLS
jgi:hypothetical protein